ncbi:hypothetical protein ACS0TY_026216 [Phlomoides rotata]
MKGQACLKRKIEKVRKKSMKARKKNLSWWMKRMIRKKDKRRAEARDTGAKMEEGGRGKGAKRR